MNTQEMVDHIKRLDRLYLAADAALRAGENDPSGVNYRRWRYYQNRYNRAVAEGIKRFGLTRHVRSDGTEV